MYISGILKIIENMTIEALTCIGSCYDTPGVFPIIIVLHQTITMPISFYTNYNELTADIQQDILWCMLYENDVLFISEKRTTLNIILDFWGKEIMILIISINFRS